MPIDWTDPESIVDTLGEKYVHALLGNMPGGATVRLGETGDGIAPNYQVESEGSVTLFRGSSHRPWTGGQAAFDRGKISARFERQRILDTFLSRFRKARVRPDD